jgi:DNA-binding GntR family transcriptional regulator
MKELLEGVAVRLLAERNRLPEIDALEENLRSIRVSSANSSTRSRGRRQRRPLQQWRLLKADADAGTGMDLL